ncbi:putative lipoprotein [Corallococcus macrosporus]|uniref:Putative lipoprotein n=2 Tax=Myxococcaceae TaxID=31 RepID=F8C951_MYXFH|nr:putative lipoprotein [Corallococcus macrosporus]
MVAALALSTLVGCGGDDDDNPGGTPQKVQCDASNCAGCCFNNVCQTGTSTSACGSAGAACRACGAAQVCKADQTCGVDPEGVWRVQPVSAQIAATNNGSAWDADGSPPDVFIEMACPGGTAVFTTAAVEGLAPAWTSGGCTARASQLMAEQWAFQVWDEDLASDDTITGVLVTRFTEQHFTAGTVVFGASGGMTSLTVRLEKQP